MDNFTFEQMPQALRLLHEKIDRLEQLLVTQRIGQDREPVLNVKEAAAFLHLSVATLYVKVCRREVPFNKQGKRLYFYRDELDDWVRQGRKKTLSEVQQEACQYFIGKRKI